MRKALIPAVLAALVASGCAATASGVASRHHPARAAHPGCPKLAASRSPRAGGVLLDAGRTGTRTQVPWAKVGPGWVLAEYSTTSAPDSSPKPRPGPVWLYLIDPAGGRYLMYRWAPDKRSLPQLIDWSPDGARALVEQAADSADNAPTAVSQITLATGKVTTFGVPWDVYPQEYTRPGGQAMLATSGDQQVTLWRYCLTGRRGPALARAGNLGFSQSQTGTLAVWGSTGASLVSPAGAVIRRLPVPGAKTAGGCEPVRWWNAGTVLAVCYSRGLWLVPASGAAPRRLSPPRDGHGVDPAGDIGAWRLPNGLYLQAVGACSQIYIVRQLPAGQVQAVDIPGTQGNNNGIIASLGTRLLVQARTGCPGSNSLLWFDPATRAVQMLLSAPHDAVGVLGAIARVR